MKLLALCLTSVMLVTVSMTSSAAEIRTQEKFSDWRRKHEAEVQKFESYLKKQGVETVVPVYQLLRTASDWDGRACRLVGAQPFEVPPDKLWPATVKTLKLIEHLRSIELLPPFQVVSAYRNKDVERCAEGGGSRHPKAGAVDLVPVDPQKLESMIRSLCDFWWQHGKEYSMGLSVYQTRRVHIDTIRWGTWGNDWHFATSVCRR